MKRVPFDASLKEAFVRDKDTPECVFISVDKAIERINLELDIDLSRNKHLENVTKCLIEIMYEFFHNERHKYMANELLNDYINHGEPKETLEYIEQYFNYDSIFNALCTLLGYKHTEERAKQIEQWQAASEGFVLEDSTRQHSPRA